MLLKNLLVSKRQMRRELSANQVVYNSFSIFAREMKLPFQQARHLWKYLSEENQKLFVSVANAVTSLGREAMGNMKNA